MAISFKCGGCAKQYTVKDELAGKRAQCKKCGTVMQIPNVEVPVEPALHDDFAVSADPNANTETVAGSLINSAMGTVAGRGASQAGRSSAGRSGISRADEPPPEADYGQPGLESLKHVAQAEQEAFDVNGGTEQYVRRERGPATRNRAPMEPFSFILTVAMLALMGYLIYAAAANPITSKPYTADVLTEAGKPWALAASRFGVYIVLTFALMAPLVLGAWYAALKIINVRTPDGFYMRSLGIASVGTMMLGLAWAGPLAALTGIGIGLALVALGACFALLHFIHGQKPAVSGITTGIAAGLGFVGILVSQSVAEMVQKPMQDTYEAKLASIVKKKEDARIAKIEEDRRKAEEARNAPTPEQTAAAEASIKELQAKVTAFKATLGNKQQTREKLAETFTALTSAVETAQKASPTRTEFANIAAELQGLKAEIDTFPTTTPPADLAEAPPAGQDWSGKAGRHEVSAFAFNLTPPLNSVLDISAAATPGAPLKWQIANTGTTMTVEQFTSPMANQERPWLAPAFILADAKDAPFAIAVEGEPAVEYGKINGLNTAKITLPDASRAGSSTVIYAIHKGPTWLKVTVGPTTLTDDAMSAALLSVRSIRERNSGEPAIDPLPLNELVSRYASDSRGNSGLIDLIKSKPNAEDAVVKGMGISPDDSTLEKFGPLIVATATEKNSPLLWKLAASNSTIADPARDALRKIQPAKADDIAFALIDLKNPSRSRSAIKTLAYSDQNPARQADVSKALIAGIEANAISVSDGDATTEAALEKWFDDDIGKRFQEGLNKASYAAGSDTGKLPVISNVDSVYAAAPRKLAIRVLAASPKPAKYAGSIASLLLVDTDVVSEALVGMGAPAAEPELLKALNTMAKGEATNSMRKASLAILEQIGTKRCLGALQKMASQSGDTDLVERAKALHKKLRESPDKPATTTP